MTSLEERNIEFRNSGTYETDETGTNGIISKSLKRREQKLKTLDSKYSVIFRCFLYLCKTGHFNFPSDIREGLSLVCYLTSHLLSTSLLLWLHTGELKMLRSKRFSRLPDIIWRAPQWAITRIMVMIFILSRSLTSVKG